MLGGTYDVGQAGKLTSSLALPVGEISATLKPSDSLGGSSESEVSGYDYLSFKQKLRYVS